MGRMDNWEIFFTVYRDERKRGKDHSKAVASTVANWVHDAKAAKAPAIPRKELEALLKTLESWDREGSADYWDLRARLRQAVVDSR